MAIICSRLLTLLMEEDVEMAEADKRVTSAQADASVEHPAEFAGGKPGE